MKAQSAIFGSPIIEKVFYLDIPVNEKIVIGESFEIRDLIYCTVPAVKIKDNKDHYEVSLTTPGMKKNL